MSTPSSPHTTAPHVRAGCNICVTACPINVYEALLDAPPRIARQDEKLRPGAAFVNVAGVPWGIRRR